MQLTRAQADFFEAKVRPVLVNNCYKCHSAESTKVKGELLLDTPEGVLKGGKTGPAVVPGDPEKSLLIKAVRYNDEDLQMPPKGEKLMDGQINDLETWVKMGAPYPRTTEKIAARAGKTEAAKSHWAFQPVKKPVVPEVLVVHAVWTRRGSQPLQRHIAVALRAVAELIAGAGSWSGCGGSVALVAAGRRQPAIRARARGVRWPPVRALDRLWMAQMKVHSAAALSLPRMESCRKPMLCLMWPWGVSAMWPRWR